MRFQAAAIAVFRYVQLDTVSPWCQLSLRLFPAIGLRSGLIRGHSKTLNTRKVHNFFLDMTGQSLKLIENFWGTVATEFYADGTQYLTVHNLKTAILVAWNRISLENSKFWHFSSVNDEKGD